MNAQTFTTFCKRSRRANLQILPVDGGVGEQRASVHLFRSQWFVSRKHLRPEQPCVKSKCYSHVSSTQRSRIQDSGRRVSSALPGVLVIESCRLTMQMILGLLHAVLASLQRLRASAKYQSELESQALIKHDVCDDLLPDKNVKLSKCLCSNPCVHASTCGPAVACDTLSYQSPRLECLSDCFGPVHGV